MASAENHRPTRLKTLRELPTALRARGEQTALIAFGARGCNQVSYRKLAEIALAFGDLLAARQPKHDRLIIMAPPSTNYFVAVLGALHAGICVIPVDTQLPEAVLRHVVADSGAHLVVTTHRFAEQLKKQVPDKALDYVLLDILAKADPVQKPNQSPGSDGPRIGIDSNAPAVLFYTSGTTGMPKGVPLSHGNLIYQIETIARQRLLDSYSRILLPLPLHHVYPFVLGLLTPLYLGATLVLPAGLTGPQLINALTLGEVTHLIGVPRFFEALLSAIDTRLSNRGTLARYTSKAALALSGWLRSRTGIQVGRQLLWPLHKHIGPRLKVLASGGAPLSVATVAELEALGWQVAIGYGLTETSPLISLSPPGMGTRGSVGRVIEGTEVRIAPTANVVAPAGEIQVRGPGVFKAYHQLPEASAQAFTEDGWFRTGDIGRLDREGKLYISGRASTLIVTGSGENVQPDQLEEMYSAHPAIREIGIVQHNGGLAAVIVPDVSALPGEQAESPEQAVHKAIEECSRELASYQRLGHFVISRNSLARTRIGKLQRQELQKRYEDLCDAAQRKETEPLAPVSFGEMSTEDRSLLEQESTARIWSWLVKTHPHTRLNPDSDLRLDLNIDSLDWIELSLSIRELTGVELNEQLIGSMSRVRDLLIAIASAEPEVEAAAQGIELFEQPEADLSKSQRRRLTPLPKPLLGLSWLIYWINRLVMRGLFRLRVSGLENIPEHGACIIAPNHISYLDPFAIGGALSFKQVCRTYWAGWAGVLATKRWQRLGSRLARAIPVDPDRPTSSLAVGAAVLKKSGTLVWFPEGRRSPDGQLQVFKQGIGQLLTHMDVPVVPTVITGSDLALPCDSWRFHLRPIHLNFGKPISSGDLLQAGHGVNARDRITDALYKEIKTLQANNP